MRDAAEIEGKSHEVDLAISRLEVRRRLREALIGERSQRLVEGEDWERLVHEHDQQHLLREQEIEMTRLTDTQENRRRRENRQWELERAEAAQRQRESDWEFERRKRAQQWDEEHRRREETLRLRRAEQDVDHENLAGKLGLLK